ncbi:hypothetical protein [Streptomyces sp. NPDC058155]|uniref:hypothetical protein n=1 Tax=Streptomyces sp. NPDC058155 TaxID=3346359 RepID=UPI0036EC5914
MPESATQEAGSADLAQRFLPDHDNPDQPKLGAGGETALETFGRASRQRGYRTAVVVGA